VREMQQATIFSPVDAYYNVRLGAQYRRMLQFRDAAVAVRQAVRLAPTNAAYHCLLADLYSELRLDKHAVFHYQRAGVLDAFDAEQLKRLRRHAGIEDDSEWKSRRISTCSCRVWRHPRSRQTMHPIPMKSMRTKLRPRLLMPAAAHA